METPSTTSAFTSAPPVSPAPPVSAAPPVCSPPPVPPAAPAHAPATMSGAPPKAWYASAGVWGAVVTLVGSVLALLKVEVDPRLLEDVREWVLAAATLAGGAVALWGRVRASRRIGPPDAGAPKPPTLPPPTSAVGLRARGLLPWVLAPLLVVTDSGCAAAFGPDASYVNADRATFHAVAPEYRAYVTADPSLGPERRARRLRTLELWRVRLEDAERRLHRDLAAPPSDAPGAESGSEASPANATSDLRPPTSGL